MIVIGKEPVDCINVCNEKVVANVGVPLLDPGVTVTPAGRFVGVSVTASCVPERKATATATSIVVSSYCTTVISDSPLTTYEIESLDFFLQQAKAIRKVKTNTGKRNFFITGNYGSKFIE